MTFIKSNKSGGVYSHKIRPKYPKYALFWVNSDGKHGRYHTRRKNSLQLRLNGLSSARMAFFNLFYGDRKLAVCKYDDGKIYDYFENVSREYKLPEELPIMKRDLSIFLSKEELESCL